MPDGSYIYHLTEFIRCFMVLKPGEFWSFIHRQHALTDTASELCVFVPEQNNKKG